MNRYMRKAIRDKRRVKLAAGMTMVAELTAEDRLEKEEELEVDRLYEHLGCEIVKFSQPRETMQSEGIPDRKIYCRRKRLTWWHEVKRPVGGEQSKKQKEFQERAEACGEIYLCGPYSVAYAFLVKIGVIRQ